eukprot:Phypoly_transcript_11728.p1 GENE.Phypoly_transcript_11728~~Phypoly_transcript_11728.p1  ORF type:complete len:337 (+),score=41.82 Phypoly_transcript_11728:105-1115(+)
MSLSLHLCIFFALLLPVAYCQTAIGLNSSTVVGLCAKGCSWDTPDIWQGGAVPNPGDYITIYIPGTYVIQVSGNVTVGDLNIGIDDTDHNDGRQTLEILPGATFTSNQQYTALLSSVVQVDANASFIIAQKGNTQGAFIVAGLATFGQDLTIGTSGTQLPTSIVHGSLTLLGGTVQTANGVSVSSTSNVVGTGTIIGDVDGKGNFYPGKDAAIGTLNINGAFNLADSTELNIDIASASSFDTIIATGNCYENGKVLVSTLNKFVPLSHQYFWFLNYSDSRNGFDKTSADCPITCLPGQNKWEVSVHDHSTALIYDDAATILISFFTIALCLLTTLL